MVGLARCYETAILALTGTHNRGTLCLETRLANDLEVTGGPKNPDLIIEYFPGYDVPMDNLFPADCFIMPAAM